MTDLLLEWLSYRGAGRRDDLPEDLLQREPPAWMLADLAALGHLDLLPDRRWRVAPPVLASTADDSGLAPRAILCGARTPKILARLQDAVAKSGAELRETPEPSRPSILEVTAKSFADLPEIAVDASIIFQRDAGFTLLACLPTIRHWPRTPCPMVAGRVQDVKRFSRSHLSWVPSSLEKAAHAERGFFRIRRQWDWLNLLKEAVDAQAEIEASAGRLAAAKGAKALHWDAASRQLSLSFALYPPTLITRALVLCSGLLPFRDRGRRLVCFQGVPGRVARLAQALTGLRFA
jgi:hypothetical protein